MSISRNKRRVMKKDRENVISKMGGIDAQKIMITLVGRMAESGPAILQALVEGGGSTTSSGFAVDGLMNAASHMETAIAAGDAEKLVTTAVHVLFLARHIAILEGKIKVVEQMAKA